VTLGMLVNLRWHDPVRWLLRGGWTTALLLYLGLHWTPMAWDHLIRLQTGAAGLVRT
jgi:hypothetical protein